jgi:hypothetical protein
LVANLSPFLCKIHGRVAAQATSPALGQLLAEGNNVLPRTCRVIRVEIDCSEEYGTLHCYYFDREFAQQFFALGQDTVVRLRDRSKVEKKLYDRVLINALFRGSIYVCPRCLEALVSS